ncbi:MAG TPA: VOC family protein [Roseiflexaceae bacterium]|nr:VOC family protein [Roseiflexaceae bacterium]
MSSTPFGLSRIGQIALPVRDLDRAVTFYRDVLGLAFLFRVPNLAFFDCGGVRLLLSPPETAELERHSSIIYFTVEDINSAHRILSDRGAPFDDQPHIIANMDTYDLWMAFLRDPDGNLLGIMSEVPRET